MLYWCEWWDSNPHCLDFKSNVSCQLDYTHTKGNTMSYKGYSDNDIIELAKEVKSIRQLLFKLSLIPAGGNYANLKRNLQRLNVDTSHWTGQGWSKGQQLKDWSSYTTIVAVKKHLIATRGYSCESCSLSHWLGSSLSLELDHIDGDRTHNEPTNLRILCPNCHSQTPTWRRKK